MMNTLLNAEFNKATKELFDARLAKANLVAGKDFQHKLKILNKKMNSNKTKHLLVEHKLTKLKSFDLGYFIGKSHFDGDGSQKHFVFQPISRYFTLNSNWITEWKSKGVSNESLEVVPKTDHTLTESVNYYRGKVRLSFRGSVLQQKLVTCDHKIVVKIYMVYEVKPTFTTFIFQYWKMHYLKLLNLLKALTLTNTDILVIELDMIYMDFFTS